MQMKHQGPLRLSVTGAQEWEGCSDLCLWSHGERAVRGHGGCCS